MFLTVTHAVEGSVIKIDKAQNRQCLSECLGWKNA